VEAGDDDEMDDEFILSLAWSWFELLVEDELELADELYSSMES
jgi:hypothetical protein